MVICWLFVGGLLFKAYPAQRDSDDGLNRSCCKDLSIFMPSSNWSCRVTARKSARKRWPNGMQDDVVAGWMNTDEMCFQMG